VERAKERFMAMIERALEGERALHGGRARSGWRPALPSLRPRSRNFGKRRLPRPRGRRRLLTAWLPCVAAGGCGKRTRTRDTAVAVVCERLERRAAAYSHSNFVRQIFVRAQKCKARQALNWEALQSAECLSRGVFLKSDPSGACRCTR
jgi:hypothetical protein